MPLIGGKNGRKKKTSSSDSNRHFTVVMGNKEHGLYVSSSPSSAARKAVSKLCATDKKKKVQFSIREITQGSKKKTYGPYLGEIEKLKEPIELKGRVIRYKPVAKLNKKTGAKMKGGVAKILRDEYAKFEIQSSVEVNELFDLRVCFLPIIVEDKERVLSNTHNPESIEEVDNYIKIKLRKDKTDEQLIKMIGEVKRKQDVLDYINSIIRSNPAAERSLFEKGLDIFFSLPYTDSHGNRKELFYNWLHYDPANPKVIISSDGEGERGFGINSLLRK